MTEAYDSRKDTERHQDIVFTLMQKVASAILNAGDHHDMSKLSPEEKPIFDVYTPKLRGMTYGSPEYMACMGEMKKALDHHYAVNTHHPDHFENGIDGMTLVDVVEMFCDWMAAGFRHADGDMKTSIDKNVSRFGLSPQLASIFKNTVDRCFDYNKLKASFQK